MVNKAFMYFSMLHIYFTYAALLWQKEASDKSDISLKKSKNESVIPLMSMEYHDVFNT